MHHVQSWGSNASPMEVMGDFSGWEMIISTGHDYQKPPLNGLSELRVP